MLPEQLGRLAEVGIDLLPFTGISSHFVFYRDGFVALVERTPAGFGEIGSPGLLTEKGLAPLVWRGGHAFFVAKGFELPAAGDDVDRLRRFASDLEQALR